MSRAYRQALRRLAAIRAGLDAEVSALDRSSLLDDLDDVLAVLNRSEHRTNTQAQARRVQNLDRQLADRPPGERTRIIAERTGCSRSAVYELRKVQLSPDGKVL